MERKSVQFELKDFSKQKRTSVIAHSVYGNIDRVGDISCKGMFTSSWNRGEKVAFRFNHDASQTPGSVLRTFEDEQKAYTEVKFGNWTLGNDVMEMVEAEVITGASFGYETEKKDYQVINNRKIRKLLQVRHIETSLLTIPPANPLAGVVSLTKAFDVKQLSQTEADALQNISVVDMGVMEKLINLAQGLDANSDLYIWVMDQISRRSSYLSDVRYQLYYNTGLRKSLSEHVEKLEKFSRNATASDECIKMVQDQLHESKQLLLSLDTAVTPLITDGIASEGKKKEFINQLYLLTVN